MEDKKIEKKANMYFCMIVLIIMITFIIMAIIHYNPACGNFGDAEILESYKNADAIDYNKLLYAIAMVESNNGANVFGDYSKEYTKKDVENIVKNKDKKSFINATAPGSNSPALGKYQIQSLYWLDGCEYLKVDWEHWDALDNNKASKIVIAYLQRYGAKARIGREPTYKDLALIHHLGPRGYREDFKTQAREAYWEKIKKHLK